MHEFKGSNCIVTGGSGFIGQHLVKKLISLKANVFVIDNFSFGASKESIDKNAHIIKGDMCDRAVFYKLPKKKYDYFFHFAGPSSVLHFKEMATNCVDITTVGFLNCLHFCKENNVKLTFPSSGNVYSGSNHPYTESTELNYNALNTYAKNKFLLEKLSDLYREQCNILDLRLLTVYGPGESHKSDKAGIIYSFCRQMLAGKSPVIWGDGKQQRDFIFIDDVVNILINLSKNCSEPIVNVGSGESISYNEIIKIINRHLETKIVPIYVERPEFYEEKTSVDITLLRKYYKKPLTDVSVGIKKTIDSFKK